MTSFCMHWASHRLHSSFGSLQTFHEVIVRRSPISHASAKVA